MEGRGGASPLFRVVMMPAVRRSTKEKKSRLTFPVGILCGSDNKAMGIRYDVSKTQSTSPAARCLLDTSCTHSL